MSNINSKDHQDFYDFIHGKKTETKQPSIHTAQEYDLPPVKPRPRPVQKKYPLYEDDETYRHPPVRQAPQKPVEPPQPKRAARHFDAKHCHCNCFCHCKSNARAVPKSDAVKQ